MRQQLITEFTRPVLRHRATSNGKINLIKSSKAYKMSAMKTLLSSVSQTQKQTAPLRSSRNFEKNEYKIEYV